MAQLTFRILSDGLIVNALVNLEAPVLLPLWSSGQARPATAARGPIDTASNISGVARLIL
jgi:hypothetical protein